MNSRKLASHAAAMLMLMASMFSVTGCTPSKAGLIALTNTLSNAAEQVATLEGNTALAATLKTDTAAAVAAINGWTNGTPAQNVIQALNILEDDLNLIPAASPYSSLIDIAIGAVEGILALLPSSTTASHAVHRSVILTQPAPKTSAEFKKQWNQAAVSRGLNAAILK